MSQAYPQEVILPNVLVPATLVKAPEQFGGIALQDCRVGDLIIRDNKVRGLVPATKGGNPRLILPKLTECHVHLDKCHTISRLSATAAVGGDLRAAIDQQEADKRHWTAEDLHQRASRGLDELIASGCRNVRSHVDWSGTNGVPGLPLAWHVLRDIAADRQDQVRLQIAPLIGIDQLAIAGFADTVAAELAKTGGVLGAFVFDQPDRREGISAMVKAAATHGLALDFHVDEGLADGLDGLEMIADAVIETGCDGPVLCGHACSLMNIGGEDMKRLADKLRRANITIASLPVTNLYLQGRGNGTPDRRGVTRIHELRELGVSVIIGTDNVRDAFSPLGQHNPLESLKQAVLAAHLDPPFAAHLPMVTTDAERALGLSPTFIDGASVADLIVFDAANLTDLLSEPPAPIHLSTYLAESQEGEIA